MIGRFDAARDDGQAFREAAFAALEATYRKPIQRAITSLSALEFDFPEIGKVHAEQLRYDLLFRQSLPFCITEEAFFRIRPSSSKVLAALLAGHTLALTQLDYHFDGSSPHPAATATARKIDMATAVAYTVRMLYVAGKIADEVGGAAKLFRDAFDPISGFVVLRMHQDSRERYSDFLLREAKYALNEYLSGPTSRLLSSGYWELMIRGSFSSHGVPVPERLIQVAQKLRMLRQLVDEIADFDEDIRAGLVTAPLLFAVSVQARQRRIERAVRSLWSSRSAPEEHIETLVGEIRQLVAAQGGFKRASEYADKLWQQGVALCEKAIGTKGAGFLLLLDLKRAKLAELDHSNAASWAGREIEHQRMQ